MVEAQASRRQFLKRAIQIAGLALTTAGTADLAVDEYQKVTTAFKTYPPAISEGQYIRATNRLDQACQFLPKQECAEKIQKSERLNNYAWQIGYENLARASRSDFMAEWDRRSGRNFDLNLRRAKLDLLAVVGGIALAFFSRRLANLEIPIISRLTSERT